MYAPLLGFSCPQERGRVRLRDMSRQSYVPLIPSYWGRWELNLQPTALYSPQVVGLTTHHQKVITLRMVEVTLIYVIFIWFNHYIFI